jgi:ribosome-associated protein
LDIPATIDPTSGPTVVFGSKSIPDVAAVLSAVTTVLDDTKAEDVVVIDLSGKTSIADYMVIACGTSARHVGAMTSKLREELKAMGLGTVSCEGEAHCDWVLIDAGDVVVHLFRPEVRTFYSLERLWGGPALAAAATTTGPAEAHYPA